MVKNHNFSTGWRRALAVFSLNDPKWGRGESSGSSGSDDATSNGRNEQNRPPDDKPGRGRDKRDGPPDLDELWRDFNQRLNQLFNRKGGGGNGRAPLDSGGSGRAGSIGILAVLGVALLVWLASGIYIVQEGQAGVVLRFGRYVDTTPAGIQWRAPYPFESDEIVNMAQVRSIEVGRDSDIRNTDLKDSSMLTADENIIDVRFAVQYRIKDAKDFLMNNADAEASVSLAAQTAVREIVGKNTMDYVLFVNREQVGIDLPDEIQRILDLYKTGILVTSVAMDYVKAPEQVQAAFQDVTNAEQDRVRVSNEAQAYASDVVPRATGKASRMLEEAEGYKSRVVAQAQGDATRFDQIQAAYAAAPGVTRERMYLDTMQQIYSRSSKVLIDAKGNNSLIYLPLDKLLGSGAGASDTTGSAGKVTSATAPPRATGDSSAMASGDSTNHDVDATPSEGDVAGNDPLRSRALFRSRGRSEQLQDVQ